MVVVDLTLLLSVESELWPQPRGDAEGISLGSLPGDSLYEMWETAEAHWRAGSSGWLPHWP